MFEISPQKVVHVIYLARETGAGDAELHAFIDALRLDSESALNPAMLTLENPLMLTAESALMFRLRCAVMSMSPM